jgi:hypothetical protein
MDIDNACDLQRAEALLQSKPELVNWYGDPRCE